MFRLIVLLAFASVVLAALALISSLSVEDETRIRGLPRFAWVIIILLVPLAGPIAWFVAGRPVPQGRPQGRWPRGRWPIPGGLPEPPSRTKAPDDDPDFLRSLDQQENLSPDDEEMLRQWEEDLRRREDELRRGDTDPDR